MTLKKFEIKQHFPIFINYVNLLSLLWVTGALLFNDYSIVKAGYYFFFFSFVIEFFTDKKWQNIKKSKTNIYFIGMFIFFLLAIIWLPFEQTNEYSRQLIEKRLPLLGFAVVGFCGVNRLYKLKYFLYAIISISIFAILFLVFYKIGIVDFLKNQNKGDLFAEARILHINGHMEFNFYLNLSVVSIWYILRNRWRHLVRYERYFFIAALTLIFGTLSITEGRSGFTGGMILFLIIIFIELYRRRKILGFAFAFILPLLFVGMASNQRRISVEKINEEPRLFLWKTAWEVAKDSPIFGQGISDAQVNFDKKIILFETPEFKKYKESDEVTGYVDCHNQYMQTFMEFGILGLIVLLFLYFYPVLISDKERKVFSFIIIFLCAYQSVFDMFITGPFSPIFGILILMMLVIKSEKKVDKEYAITES